MDHITELVSHFVGIFHIAVEEERLRDAYEEFKALRAADPESGPLLDIEINLRHSYALEDFTPRIKYEQTTDVPQPNQFVEYYPYQIGAAIQSGLLLPEYGPERAASISLQLPGPGRDQLTLEPAGSVVTVTFQYASLTDNDILRLGDEAVFVDSEFYTEELHTLVAVAYYIQGPTIEGTPSLEDGGHGFAHALYVQMGETEDPGIEGVTITVMHGGDMAGYHVNGETVDELTPLDQLLPLFLQTPASDGEEDSEAPVDTALPADDPSLDIFDVESGHNVVTGANLLVNEAGIVSAWLDASVISVMGDVISLNLISQTNVLVEHDNFAGASALAGSSAFNVATFSHTSSEPAPDPEAIVEEMPSGGAFPSNWIVARVEADITVVNWVQQFTFATDFDQAEIQFSGTETYIGMGENQIFNINSLLEIGYGYDLIIVGGHMISVNMISQLNVLLDNDSVTYSGVWPDSATGGDNLLYNSASMSSVGIDSYGAMQQSFADATNTLAGGSDNIGGLMQNALFEGVEMLRVLFIDGDFTTLNLLEQTNILGDADQVHMALADFVNANGGDVNLSTGSNALINIASIAQYGVDSNVLVGGEVYADSLLYQAGLIDTEANPLGVGITALANEAVAFLADGMIETAPANEDLAPPTIDDGSPCVDVMQTMLA